MATSSSAIQKKIETLKKGLNNKFITAAQKEKIKAQVQKLESQSKALTPKKATKPTASSSLTRLQKLVKNKKYGVYKGAGVDLKKDSDRPAKAIGKRIAKSGKTYYEYRANRIDVKQPPKKYPKLEDGGMMAKGGETLMMGDEEVYIKKSSIGLEDEICLFYKKDDSILKCISKNQLNKFIEQGKLVPKKEKGGYMAKGGEVGGRGWSNYEKGDRITNISELKVGQSYLEYNKQFNSKNIIRITSGDKTPLNRDIVYAGFVRDKNDKRIEGDFAIWGYTLGENEIYEIKETKMAKGGEMPNSQNLFSLMKLDSKNGHGMLIDGKVYTKKEADLKKDAYMEEMFYNANTEDDMDMEVKIFSVYELLSRKSLPKTTKAKLFSSLQDKQKEIESLTERFADDKYDWKKDYANGGMMAKGGYMADGGSIQDVEKYVADKYFYGDTRGFSIGKDSKGKYELFVDNIEMFEAEYGDYFEKANQIENDINSKMEKGGYMAKGGILKGRNNETGESFGVVIGSVKKSDENIEGGTEMNVRKSYSSRISEIKLVFDKNGNLYEITDFGYGLEGNYPDTSRGSGRNYNADKKETLEVLSKKYNPAFAKKLIELAKNPKMAEGGMTEHGLRIGDKITTDMFWDNQIVVENTKTNKRAQIDLETGKRKDEMEKGGVTEKEVVESNADMVLSKIKEVHHHADELGNVVSAKSNIEAWVVAKIERASTDLSDITHYLEGNKDKMSMGGTVRYYAHKMDKK